jgi:lipoate synthase
MTNVNGKEQFFPATWIEILHADFRNFHAEVKKILKSKVNTLNTWEQ